MIECKRVNYFITKSIEIFNTNPKNEYNKKIGKESRDNLNINKQDNIKNEFKRDISLENDYVKYGLIKDKELKDIKNDGYELNKSNLRMNIIYLKNLAKAYVVNKYPPLYDINNSYVAQYEHTIYINDSGREILS